MNIYARAGLRLGSMKRWKAYRVLAFPRRLLAGLRYILRPLPIFFRWLISSREEANFTYDLTERCRLYLAATVSQVTGAPLAKVEALFAELDEDEYLRASIVAAIARSPWRAVTDALPAYGRRIAWYAVARIIKPRVVIETGVDKGLGAAVLCAALLRNAAEGSPGRYIGTDINPAAGWMVTHPYRMAASFMIGDSIESLRVLAQPIDMFINDSDHSAEYEAGEYRAVASKLSPNAIVLGDNAHVTDALASFAKATGRRFLFTPEMPRAHWYRGGGVGFGFVDAHQTSPVRTSVQVVPDTHSQPNMR